MKFERTRKFRADFKGLSQERQDAFVAAAREFNEACDRLPPGATGPFPRSLRVKPMQGAPGVWEMTWEYHDGRATNAGASSSALVLSSCRSKMPPKGETMTSGDVWVVCRRTHSMRHEDLARFESEGEARAYAADQPGTSQNAGDHRSLFLIRRGSNGSEEMIELGRTT